MSKREAQPTTNWFKAIGRKGRVAFYFLVVFVVVWTASLFMTVRVRLTSDSSASIGRGCLRVKLDDSNLGDNWRFHWMPYRSRPMWSYSNQKCFVLPNPGPIREFRSIQIPLWPVVLIPLIVFGRQFARRPRYIPGHCAHCGYNLTGNESGVCPECGDTESAT